MIGIRQGPRQGSRQGLRQGSAADVLDLLAATDPLAGVTRDATSGIYCPATVGEWATVLAVAGIASGGPSALHGLQDASGNPTDSIGSFTLTAAGTGISYRQAVTGWTRLAIGMSDGGTGALSSTDAGLPDASTTSCTLLAYAKNTTLPASNRDMAGIGTTTTTRLIVQLTGFPRVLSGANSVIGVNNTVGQVRPFVLKHNRTGTTDAGYTDQERIAPTFSTLTTGKGITLGQVAAAHGPTQYLYAAWFFGSAAELSDAQVRTLLTTLGWSPQF